MKHFYDRLWTVKDGRTPEQYERPRDWFHRCLLDHLIDPYAHSRLEAARNWLTVGERLLDIGCWGGEGTLATGALEKYREVHGVDITEVSVDRARERGIRARVVDLNREPLPYDAAFFDCVLMLAVLEHVMDPYFALREIRRVLRPTGTFVVAVPNAASFSNRVRILFGRAPVTSREPGCDGGHLHYFTPHDLKRLLEETGFRVVARATTGGMPWLKTLLFSMTGEFVYKCAPSGG